MHLLADALPGPVFEPAADPAVRAPGAGDALISAAMYQRRDHMLKHHPVGHPAAVTAQRMRRVKWGRSAPSSTRNSTQIGSSRHDGTAGTGHLDDQGP